MPAYKLYGNKKGKLEMLSALSLINKVNEGCTLDELYSRGIRCYEELLDFIENHEIAKEASRVTKLPPEKIRSTAIKIVNLFLFNEFNNPFLSLGLSDDTSKYEIKTRRKRLLKIYHPDRRDDKKGFEEVTKKINQAYGEITEHFEERFYHEKPFEKQVEITRIKGHLTKVPPLVVSSKYLRYLPSLILIVAIAVALITVVLFILHVVHRS